MSISFVFLLSFLLPSSSLWSQDVETTTPDYQWLSQVDLPTVTSGDLNYDDLTIAIATDPQRNVYTLTFGKGVDKRDAEGNLLQKGFIAASQLDSPRDLAIDNQGYIYIADYLAAGDTFKNNGKIRVFDPNGNYLPDQTIFTSFYRPLGLDIVGDKIFVAEYYDGLQGPEKGSTYSRICIYDKVTKALLKENRQAVIIPLRLAVDSFGNIYVSQAGNNDPSVTVFNSSLQVTGELPGIVSPGSIVVDDFDFIHVIEYGNRFDFSEFINFEALAFGEILDISEEMMLGIQNEEFFIKVYSPDKTLANTIVDHIDFPVDLAMSSCEKLYIDNTTIFGSYIPFFGYTPSRLEFDLEMYKRNPSFDAAQAPEITCEDNMEVEAVPGENYAIVEFPDAVATDNCSVLVTQTKGLVSGSQFPVGENIIEYTATDTAGNTAICSFTIIVNGSDFPPQFTDCPVEKEVSSEPGKCGAIVTFDTPVATDETGSVVVDQITGLLSGSLFPVGDTEVNFQAIDAQGNTSNCTFTVSVSDIEPPVLDCPQSLVYTVGFGATGRIVEYADPVASDNCSGVIIKQTAGLPSGSNFPIGVTENTFLVTDVSNNTATCSFTITITEEEKPSVEITSCPASKTLNLNSDCSAQLPDLTGEISTSFSAEIVQSPEAGTSITGNTSVVIKATDAYGNQDTCTVAITVQDVTPPTITCPADKEFSFDPADGFTVPDFSAEVIAEDNCDFEVFQEPGPGSVIDATQEIKITVKDASGNQGSCNFNLSLTEEQQPAVEITSCPTSKTLNLSSDCTVEIPDLTGEISTSIPSEIVQSPEAGTPITGNISIVITVTDANGNQDTCTVAFTIQDVTPPTITCPADKEFSFDPADGFTVPDFTGQVVADDNCSFQVIQEPDPGNVIFGTKEVVITVTDASGNQSSCSFNLSLTEEEQPAVEITSCPASKTLNLNSDCSAQLPDLTGEISTSISAEIVQNPEAGTPFTENTSVLITVTDVNGNQDTCTVPVTVQDVTPPTITCPADKEFSFDPADGFTVPDFTGEVVAEDNCDFEVVQEPDPGNVIFGTKEVLITVTDASGNQSSCNFNLSLTAEEQPAVEITSCPALKTLSLSSDCTAEIPNLTVEISTSISAEIVQNPEAGTSITENTSVLIIVTDANGNQDTCTVPVTVQDVTPPVLSCLGDILAKWNPEEGYILPDFTSNVVVEDNCGLKTIVQEPPAGTLISENTSEITFSATDNFGNSTSCSFWLHLSEEVAPDISCPEDRQVELSSNCDYILPDFTSLAGVNLENAVITQEPQPGSVLYFDTQITLTAALNNKNTSCSFDLLLKDTQPPEVKCAGLPVFKLDSNGSINITPEEIDAGSSDNCGIVSKNLSKNNFTTADLGEQEIILTVVDASGNESTCESTIIIEPFEETVSEVQCVETIILQLDENRSAILDPANLHFGGTGSIQFTISKEEFNCGDIGEQMILFSYNTPSEEGSCEIKIVVEDPSDYCNLIVDEPLDPVPFVILYPNPGDGMVKIYTSADITLKRAEIFDMRGRFLFAKDLPEPSSNLYSVDLTMYQAGVYTIKLNGEDKEYVRRAIIRND